MSVEYYYITTGMKSHNAVFDFFFHDMNFSQIDFEGNVSMMHGKRFHV